jgi:hypothetical protein
VGGALAGEEAGDNRPSVVSPASGMPAWSGTLKTADVGGSLLAADGVGGGEEADAEPPNAGGGGHGSGSSGDEIRPSTSLGASRWAT